MFTNIVVGTDGSARANAAVEHAMELAAASGATLHIVHAVPRPPTLGLGYADAVIVVNTRDELLEEGARICGEAAAGAERRAIKAETHTVEGDPADVLIEVASAVGADLVVVGNKGMSGMSRFILGSVPNRVAHHCRCNVLIYNTDQAG